jgi:CDP-paratose 2-epimerase
MKYLLTGGLGVIGSNISKLLLQQDHQITIIDPGEEPRHQWVKNNLKSLYKDKVEIRLERLEYSTLKDLETYDSIFHLGARTGIPSSKDFPVDDFNSNILATHNLLEKLRTCARKIPTIITSSVKPYAVHTLEFETLGERNVWKKKWFAGIDESFPLSFDENYAATKIAQSAIAQAYAKSYDLPIVVFRCSNLYGPAMCKGAKHGWLTHFCLSAILNKSIEIQGSGTQTRDMLWFSDVYSAGKLAMEHIEKCKGEIFNLGGGRENAISVLEAANLIGEILGRKVETTFGPGRKFEDPIFITDYNKFKTITGWESKVKVKEGIEKIIEWAEINKQELTNYYSR